MSTLAPSPAVERVPPAGPRAEPESRSIRGSAVAGVALRIVALTLSVGTGVVLARLLGPVGLGRYEAAMAWAALLGVPAGLGIEKLVVRGVAAAHARGDWGAARGLARAASISVLGVSAVLVVVVLSASSWLPAGIVVVACGVVPLAGLRRVEQATLQGLSRPVGGQIADLVVAPAAFLLLVGVAFGISQSTVDATRALWCQVGAGGLGLVAAILLTRRARPRAFTSATAEYAPRAWLIAALPFVAILGLQVVNARADVLMLAALASDADVGLYAGASRAAALVTMPLLAVNAALGPALARAHAAGDRAELQRITTQGARIALAGAVPIGLVMVIGGGLVLGVFGAAFVAATDVLVILAVAQLVNVAAGSVGLVLLMTGHAGVALRGLMVSAIVNLGLGMWLIPEYGAMGAALASAVSLVLWNVLLAMAVRRVLGVGATILGGGR